MTTTRTHRVESHQGFTEREAHWSCSCGESGDAPSMAEASRDGQQHATQAREIETEEAR